MERVDDIDDGDPIKVLGGRDFLFKFPGSMASVGWQAVNKFGDLKGHLWISDGEETVNITMSAESERDRDISVGALNSIISMAREARNYLMSLNHFNDQSS